MGGTVKIPVNPWDGFFWVIFGGTAQHFLAPEVVKKYDTLDWRNAVGTGPFMITDLVPDNVATLKKNPNYWQRNPVGPGKGDQLPYADTFKFLMVADLSTRLAAMRTARADWISDVELEDGRGLIKTNPDIKYARFIPNGRTIGMRLDKPELPFRDIKVRQALMMATDFEALKRDLYGGDAEILVLAVSPAYDWLHISLDKLPESVQALYKYNPEKAKQLLAEAGYPKGFKTKMIVQNITSEMDKMAAIKSMWARVGVDLEIQPRETGAYTAIQSAASWEEMFFGQTGASMMYTSVMSLSSWRGLSIVSRLPKDDVVDTAYLEMQKYFFVNMPKVNETFRKVLPYILEQAHVLPTPSPYNYTFWQPWIKNYTGERTSWHQPLDLWAPFVWVDQDLKEKVTGRR